MSDNIYTGVRHTVSMGITSTGESRPSAWYDLDFRSMHEDAELGLEDYLRGLFGEDVTIHHEDDVIFVDEPSLRPGAFRRFYRVSVQ